MADVSASARAPRGVPLRAGAAGLLVALLALLAGCGGDDGAASGEATTSAAPTTVAGPATAGDGQAGGTGTAPTGQGGAAGLPQACDLAPKAEIDRATGLTFSAGTASGGATRSVCAFTATDTAPGLSIGVEPAARYDAKAAASRSSVGVPGEAVSGLGEQALFFYSDRDFPEGLGGVLVRSGEVTVDITLQRSGTEQQTRDTATAIARVVLSRL